MAFSSFSNSVQTSALSFTLLSILIFFFIITPQNHLPSSSSSSLIHHRSLLNATADSSCSSAKSNSNGLFNYLSLHFCLFGGNPSLSIPFLTLLLVLYFYILIKTAQDHFSIVTTKLSSHLNLSPSMAAVTLLALGNGAPDVFASVAAVRRGQYRTGFGAILSAGTFVSALVVGFVAIYAAPCPLKPAPFVRDVSFYLIAALFLFYVYLSAEIFLWQAIGFVLFYLFFVGFVFWMDLGMGADKDKAGGEVGLIGEVEGRRDLTTVDCEIGGVFEHSESEKQSFGLRRALAMVC